MRAQYIYTSYVDVTPIREPFVVLLEVAHCLEETVIYV